MPWPIHSQFCLDLRDCGGENKSLRAPSIYVCSPSKEARAVQWACTAVCLLCKARFVGRSYIASWTSLEKSGEKCTGPLMVWSNQRTKTLITTDSKKKKKKKKWIQKESSFVTHYNFPPFIKLFICHRLAYVFPYRITIVSPLPF